MNDASLSVIIPTFNRTSLVLDCLASLRRQTRRADSIIVVDDGSSEDVSGVVQRHYPETRVVRLPHNRGFCHAVNVGVAAANTEFVFLLNNDMTLDEQCLAKLLDRADPRTLLTPMVLFAGNRGVVYCAGDRVLTNGRPEPIGFRKQHEVFAPPNRIFGVTGGAMFLSRNAFNALGAFDEAFVAYFEDADLCMRARLAGYDCALVPEAVAYHVGSASLGGKTWWRARQCFRNHALLVIKNYPLALLVRYLPAIARERAHQARMVFSSARAEFGIVRTMGIFLGATGSLVVALPGAVRARGHLRSRVLSNRDFVALLARPEDVV